MFSVTITLTGLCLFLALSIVHVVDLGKKENQMRRMQAEIDALELEIDALQREWWLSRRDSNEGSELR